MLTKDILWDFADGLLSEEQHNAVKAELLQQPQWQITLDQILAEKKQFAQLPIERTDSDFAAGLLLAWNKEQSLENDLNAPKSHTLLYILSGFIVLAITLLHMSMNATPSVGNKIIDFQMPNITMPLIWINQLLIVGAAVFFVKFIEKVYHFYSFKMNLKTY